MKSTGIVRKVDDLGRIVLPIEIRKELDLMGEDSKVEIIAKGNEIILKKYADTCIFCHDTSDLVDFNGQKICRKCVKDISEI